MACHGASTAEERKTSMESLCHPVCDLAGWTRLALVGSKTVHMGLRAKMYTVF